MSKTATNRVRFWRNRRGLSQADLAKMIGRSHSAISRIESGHKSLDFEDLRLLAEALKVPWQELTSGAQMRPHSGAPAGMRSVMVRAVAETSVWREAVHLPEGRWYPVLAPLPGGAVGDAAYGVEVNDPAMDKALPKGSVVIVMPGTPIDGDVVLVDRVRPDGLHEVLVRRYREADGDEWLWPDSSSPSHQSPAKMAEGPPTRVIGVVVADVRPTPSWQRFFGK